MGLVLGGVGVAGLVVGAVTGGFAMGLQSDSEGFCDADDFCAQEGFDARDDAFTMATVSTIGFVAGGALLATGVVLFVVGGDDEAPASAEASVGPRGISLRGRF